MNPNDRFLSGYDPTLELLTCLPPVDIKRCIRSVPHDDRPTGASIRTLQQDFNFDKQESVRRLITETQVRHRISIVTFQGPDGFCCGVIDEHYPKARMLAEAYWDRVYGEQAGAA